MAYEERSTPEAGRGLFSIKDLKSGARILEDKSPFVAVLDSHILTKACSWCFNYTDEAGSDVDTTVSACTGCKIVRYCGKACQAASWKHSHKYECKVFKALYPQVLPNTARMILQILLRHKNNVISKEDWDSFLRLEHHMDDLDKGGRGGNVYMRDTMQNVQLMARAGKEYSSSAEPLGHIESLVGRLITNTLTLTSPVFTPIGLLLSLTVSLVNHSCEPNSAVVYSGRIVQLRATDNLPSNAEFTIAYTDTVLDVHARRSDLQNRYHFSCNCGQCSHGMTLNTPDATSTLQSFLSEASRSTFEMDITTLLSQAKTSSMEKALKLIARAYQSANRYPDYPLYLSPMPQLRYDLIMALQSHKHYVATFIQCMIVHFKIQPVVYPQACHPARVAKSWVHLKITSHLGGLAMEPDFAASVDAVDEGILAKSLATRFSLDWGMLMYFLIKEVSDQVLKSHGMENKLSVEVGKEMKRLKEEACNTRGEPSKDDLQKVKSRLIEVADFGWDWWTQQMRDNRDSRMLLTSKESEEAEDGLSELLQ